MATNFNEMEATSRIRRIQKGFDGAKADSMMIFVRKAALWSMLALIQSIFKHCILAEWLRCIPRHS